MLTILPETFENLLVVQASQTLTAEDYEAVFIPEMNKLIKNHKKIRLLFYFDRDFTGWELEAMWDDAKFGLKHRHEFEKIAIVGAPQWIEWGVKLSTYFVDGQIKNFADGLFMDALDWIAE